MFNHIMCLLFQSIAVGPSLGFALDSMLEKRRNAPSKLIRIGFWCVISVILILYGVFLRPRAQVVNYAMLLLLFAGAAVTFRFFYAGRFWPKLSAFVLLLLASTAAEPMSALLLIFGKISALSLDFTQPDMLLISCVGAIASNTCIFLTATLWKRFRLKEKMPRGAWLFVLSSFCLSIPIALYCSEVYLDNGAFSPLHLLSMTAAMLINFVMIYIQYNQAEKDQLEDALLELRYQTELSRQHYRNIEAYREELAKIRHDYNNQLSAVLGLLQLGRTAEAQSTIRSLLDKIASTREYAYCGIPIVNAIVSQKAEECRAGGITLNPDLIFPEQVKVSSIDLCSIFSNLLDNAIRACSRLPEGSPRSIELTGGMQGDYLTIRCSNPTPVEPCRRPEGSGYGMKILQDIADRYQGYFRTELTDGVFTAKLILLDPL